MAAEALTVAADRTIHREVLANGLTILTEQMDHIRSVSMGIWLKAGSRNEEAEVNGISHFVEHMVFKGTTHRTAEEIAREVDSIGGNMDAFTGKETVCFNIKVLDEHLPIAVDVLSDMVLHPIVRRGGNRARAGRDLEEIKMDEDNPDNLVHEIFTQNFFKDHPLGRPILGTKETVRKFDQAAVRNYYQSKFVPENMVISAAGNLEHEAFVDAAEQGVRSRCRGDQMALHDCSAEDQLAHYAAEQEVAGAGADLHRSAVLSGQPRATVRGLCAEYAAGRRDEFAAVPERAGEAGAGVLDFLGAESL